MMDDLVVDRYQSMSYDVAVKPNLNFKLNFKLELELEVGICSHEQNFKKIGSIS